MGLCKNLFYHPLEQETLANRISLNDTQLNTAISHKDDLLDYIKPELSSTFEIEVKHWLQGSYKNFTLIRPVSKGQEFDIDVGLYLICNAENEGLSAKEAKLTLHRSLELYSENNRECKVSDPKNNCERLVYPSFFHIDLPLYYIDQESDLCKLATENDEWIDSDPKALQSWFDKKVQLLSTSQLAKLRRIIKYLKSWTAIKSADDGIAIPSIAITVLVADYFVDHPDDDDSFMATAISITNHIINYGTVTSPINGDDLLDMDQNEHQETQKKCQALKQLCQFIPTTSDSLQQYILWTGVFEHLFPPYNERKSEVNTQTTLPATTTPPKIRVRHFLKNKTLKDNQITDIVNACKDERLYFSIANLKDYPENSTVQWMVKNKDKEASKVNDLGHYSEAVISEEQFESCAYNGNHSMECLILHNGKIKGFSTVKVSISGLPRPLRNPPKKKYYKGR